MVRGEFCHSSTPGYIAYISYAAVRAKFNSHVNLLNDNFLFSSKQAAVAEVKLKHSESLITTPNCEKEVMINNKTHKTNLLWRNIVSEELQVVEEMFHKNIQESLAL